MTNSNKMFPCNQRANTDKYRGGYERTFGKKTLTYCPSCHISVSENASTCWSCKKELTPEILDRL